MCSISSAACDLRGRRLEDHPAVAHDGDVVGDVEDLLEPVRDVDDRDAVVAQRAARPRGGGRSPPRSATRSARRARAGARWPRGRGRSRPAAARRSLSAGAGRLGVDRRAEPLEHRRASCGAAPAVDERPRHLGVAEAELDVLGHGQVRDVGQLLVDEGEPAPRRVERAVDGAPARRRSRSRPRRA